MHMYKNNKKKIVFRYKLDCFYNEHLEQEKENFITFFTLQYFLFSYYFIISE